MRLRYQIRINVRQNGLISIAVQNFATSAISIVFVSI